MSKWRVLARNHEPYSIKVIRNAARLAFSSNNSDPLQKAKSTTIIKYIVDHAVQVFVETGTYYGNTVNDVRGVVQKSYTIEMDNFLYAVSRVRFLLDPRVECFNGDSQEILNLLVPQIKEKALYWLDAHYSGGKTAGCETAPPILGELTAIFKHSSVYPLILIDDICCFGSGMYPDLEVVQSLISRQGNYIIQIEHDILRAIPIEK